MAKKRSGYSRPPEVEEEDVIIEGEETNPTVEEPVVVRERAYGYVPGNAKMDGPRYAVYLLRSRVGGKSEYAGVFRSDDLNEAKAECIRVAEKEKREAQVSDMIYGLYPKLRYDPNAEVKDITEAAYPKLAKKKSKRHDDD